MIQKNRRTVDTYMKVGAKMRLFKAEDNMFRDHPDLTDEYLDVFYGSTEMEPRNDVDRKVIAMAREAADGLFKGTRN